MATSFKKKSGWNKFREALNPKKFDDETKKEFKKVAKIIGNIGSGYVRSVIQKGGFEPNKPLTVAIKSSSKSLVDQGQLFGSITYQVPSWNTVFIGVKRMDANYNVAAAVHNGVNIFVTPKMRGLFFYLWLVSIGRMGADKLNSDQARELWDKFKDWRPLKKETRWIIIPERPFFTRAFSDDGFLKNVHEFWTKAIQNILGRMTA